MVLLLLVTKCHCVILLVTRCGCVVSAGRQVLTCSPCWSPGVAVLSLLVTRCRCVVEKLLVVLRDGRTLIGFLRSIDQFGE